MDAIAFELGELSRVSVLVKKNGRLVKQQKRIAPRMILLGEGIGSHEAEPALLYPSRVCFYICRRKTAKSVYPGKRKAIVPNRWLS